MCVFYIDDCFYCFLSAGEVFVHVLLSFVCLFLYNVNYGIFVIVKEKFEDFGSSYSWLMIVS